MTEALNERLSLLRDLGYCRANATGRAFYICWCGSWKDAAMRVTADPAARDQIVAVCRPGEL